MKLWAKTIGLNQILLTSLTTVLLFSFLGELKVNLPTLARGIRFVETPLANLLAGLIPTIVYFNRAKVKTTRTQTVWLVQIVEILLFPILFSIAICVLFIFRGTNALFCSFVISNLVLGLATEIYFYFKPRIASFLPSVILLFIQLFGLQFMNWNGLVS